MINKSARSIDVGTGARSFLGLILGLRCGLIEKMQPSEALGVAAQVAVTLAGFAGIVVVFRPDSVHQWSALDRFRLSLLLMNSALPLGLAMFGMLMLSVEPAPAT